MKKVLAATPLLFSFSVLSVAACGGGSDAESTTAPGSAGPAATSAEPRVASFCAGGATPDFVDVGRALFRALDPSPAAAYLSLRQNRGTVPSPGLTDELDIVEERGALCADASERERCAEAYAAARPPIRLGLHYCFTRGDRAACANDAAGAVALLGEVRSVEGALFVAERAGYLVSCGRDVTARGAAVGDGSFRLVVGALRPGGPCGQLRRAVVTVARDGAIAELESTLVDANPGCP